MGVPEIKMCFYFKHEVIYLYCIVDGFLYVVLLFIIRCWRFFRQSWSE